MRVMSSTSNKVRVKDVSKKFGDFQVLKKINFDVLKNEFLCVLGPGGCGKTIMLRIIGGLLPPTTGTVLIDEEKVDLTKHILGYVFQEPACLPWKTVWDNVKIGFDVRNKVLKKDIPKEEVNKKITQVLKLVGLSGFEDYFPIQISGGMKQRVVIARAFAVEPNLLLMDEPFGHLDAQTRYFMEEETLRIWEELKRTVIFVTNNIEEAIYLADRIIVLSKRPAEIKAEYKIDIPRPRKYTDSKFLKLRKDIESITEITLVK